MLSITCRSLAYGELPKSERKLLREELFGVGDRADSPRTAPFAEFRIYYKDGRESLALRTSSWIFVDGNYDPAGYSNPPAVRAWQSSDAVAVRQYGGRGGR